MRRIPLQRIGHWAVSAILWCAAGLNVAANPVPLRYMEGTLHGFLDMRSEKGDVVASGELVQVAHGVQVTTRTTFHFKDGSVDDETTVFSQRHNLQLISDRHVQKGPAFPHPMDMSIDCRSGRVIVRSEGKDGKDEVKNDRLDLPPDLANGMLPSILRNIPSGAQDTTVSMLVATPKPRVVKLVVSSRGEEAFSVVGASYKAIRYEIKIELGGVPGVVAPLIGKQPPNIQAWVTGGQAPTLIREQGPIYPEGPVMSIELASPSWAESAKSGE